MCYHEISPLLRPLVHLIYNDVCDAFEVCVALQSPKQHTCGAVQQPGGRCLKGRLSETPPMA